MKKVQIEGKKIVHSLIFFYEEAATVFFKKGVLKNFKKFTGKHLCWNVLFLIKLQAWGHYGKRDSDSGFLQVILWNF